jgi:hypothetical protein
MADAQKPEAEASVAGRYPATRTLYRLAAATLVVGVAIIPVQIVVFVVSPPPCDVPGYFDLLRARPLLGLLNLDLLYILSNLLLVPLYLAFYVSLRRASESVILLAMAVGFLGLAVYFTTNPCMEMYALAGRYAVAATPAEQMVLLAAGEAAMAGFTGTAFTVYYLLSGLALLLFAGVMLRSTVFSRATARMGFIAGLMMMVPSSAGQIGIAFAMASLVPWVAFSLFLVPQFLRMARA